ncbi:MAG: hypothetical protein EA396_06490 [Anaerolineaceae bacterium]|nr:MAG: hypothetical protein EA396_06490 [Anaerolineaceae bacterium]
MDKVEILKKRDEKTIPHLKQYAPVWIVDEVVMEEEDAVQFNVVFRHNRYQWVNRRYRYDGFNNVLYHKGQRVISEDEAVDVQEQDAYISTIIEDTPNAYGG